MASVALPVARSGARLSARRIVRLLHSWVGVAAAALIVAVSLSGSTLVFVEEMFGAQYGAMLEAPAAPEPDLDRIVAAARAGGGDGFQLYGVLMPQSRIDVPVAMPFGMPKGGTGFADLTMLPVDPASNLFKGSFKLDDAVGHKVIHFHHQLIFDDGGATLMSVVGLLLAAFAASGVYLWWPRGGAAWRKALRPDITGSPLRALFHLHSFAGVWLALLVLVFAVTGSAVAKPGWFGVAALPEDPPAALAVRFAGRCAGTVTPGDAQRAAEAANPGRRLAVFGFPHEPGEPYRLSMKARGDLDTLGGDTVVFVHASCPGILATLAPHDAATRLGQAMFSLHAGLSFGVFGRALAFLAGLAATVLALSGTYVWAARQLSKRGRRTPG